MSRDLLLSGRLGIWSVRDAKGSVNAKPAQLGVWSVRDVVGSVTAKLARLGVWSGRRQGVCYCQT